MPLQPVGDVSLYFELIDYTEPWKSGRAPVVLIHGLGGSHAMWLYQVPDFSQRFSVITLDLRGHGQSSLHQTPFTVADMARDIVRLLREQGVERAHVVGLSLGGMVAQQMAVDFPLAIASLVLADTFAAVPPEMRPAMDAALQFIDDNTMADIAKIRITAAFARAVDPVMRSHFIDQVATNDKPSYVQAARAALTFGVADRIAEIRVPTLVLVGEQDITTTPSLSEDIAARIPGAKFVRLADAAHLSNLDQPVEFNRTVLDFLLGVGC